MERRTKITMDTMRNPGRYNTRRAIPFLMKDRKNKRKEDFDHIDLSNEDFDIDLSFDIHRGEGIDPPSESISERTYFLVWWVVPGIDNWAPFPVEGKPFDPAWHRIWTQRVDKHVWPGFIYVEVMRRRRDKCAAGTSGGIETVVIYGKERVVKPGTKGATVYGIESVSRCKIPLPRPGEKISGRYGLVKSDGAGMTEQGHIYVTVQLEKVIKFT